MMASMFRSGSSRRKAEAPGKIRIQLKGKNSKVVHSDEENDEDSVEEIMDDDENDRPAANDNGIPEDLPEGTIVVQPTAVEDAPVKKKRDPPVRIDTSVLDNVSCTACGRQLNPYKGSSLQKHPELKVVICKRCEKFLSSGDIAKDKDGTDEQCRWCGEGGRLVVCDDCASAFCKACVMRNFNRSEFNNINSEPKWKCYLCNKAPLQGLRENYRKIRDTLKALQARDKAKAAGAAGPTSNGTTEKSASSKQNSKGTASETVAKGRSAQSSGSLSTQRTGLSAAAGGTTQSSPSQSGSSLSPPKTVSSKVTGEVTLSLSDLNVHYENVDAVMDKLSTATNTFKEMLRALRSQFHATSPRCADDGQPIQFSLGCGMNLQDKRRRCAKALNMGLETYVKSLKTILSGSSSVSDVHKEAGAKEMPKHIPGRTSSVKETVSSSATTKSTAAGTANTGSTTAKGTKVTEKLNGSASDSEKSKSLPEYSSRLALETEKQTETGSKESSKAKDKMTSRTKSMKESEADEDSSDSSDESDTGSTLTKEKRSKKSDTKKSNEKVSEKVAASSVKDTNKEERSSKNERKNAKSEKDSTAKSNENTAEDSETTSKDQEEAALSSLEESENNDTDDLNDESDFVKTRRKKRTTSKDSEKRKESQKEAKKPSSQKSGGNGKNEPEDTQQTGKTTRKGKETSADSDAEEASEKQTNTSSTKDKDQTEKTTRKKTVTSTDSDVEEETKTATKSLSLKKPRTRKSNDSKDETDVGKTIKDKSGVSGKDDSGQVESSKNESPASPSKSASPSGSPAKKAADKDANKISENENTSVEDADDDYENMAAKFDLIKELADEMLKDNDVDDDDDLPMSFGEPVAVDKNKNEKNNNKQKSSKRKQVDLSSEDSDSNVTKRSKTVDSSDDEKREESEKTKNKTESKSTGVKDKASKEDVGTKSDESSSDPLDSDEDEEITKKRTQRKNRKPAAKPVEKTAKPVQQKRASVKTEEKSQSNDTYKKKGAKSDQKVNGKSAKDDVDDLDKEIDKLSKLPTMRKRKAADTSEDKSEETEDSKETSAAKGKAVKKSKPGPKCSKKNTDYDDLSSEEEEKNVSDVDSDDEDGPKVTFFLDAIGGDDDDEKDTKAEEENEMAKNGLLEDMESEDASDDDDDEKDDSSSEEDSDAPKKKGKKGKSKKEIKKEKKETEEDEDEEEGDSDDNIGKKRKKPLRSKLLDAKLSDSDSDVGKPKKKAKDGDEDFKDDDDDLSSPDSSLESDLTDSDEDESDKDSDEEEGDEDGPKKKKKKGKRKAKRRRKRKVKKGADDEEEEEDDDDEEGGKKKKGKGKRRRIKKMANSSDEENEDDDDDPNSSKAGKRKDIRKVMSNKKLEDTTKAAAKAEEKRRKRIAAKQREFNIETITDENNPMNCLITTKLILEPGKEEGDEPLVQVNKKLVRKLKPHQVEAVQFMWDCMYESVKRSRKEEGAGCILAHCMGLGKTLSVIAFVHTILSHEKILKHRTCLVVSPLNTVLNWRNEWTMWLDEEDQLEVWELASCKQNAARADCLKDWQESGGIMIMGYEMYRNLTTGNRCKNKRQKKVFQDALVNPGPDLVVCDEGHILKNESSAISKAMNQMKTRRRVVLTGTPLQNNLNEYHCMLSFVKPNLLGTRREFNNRFISPIGNGQCTDSTPRDVKLMKARAHILHEMLAGCVQRRDYSALTKFLPPKQEYVISVRLTNIQIELYEKYLELSGQGVDGIYNNKGARLFTDYQNLMKIWTHPWVLKLAEIRDEMKMKYDDEDSFIDDETDEERSFSSSDSSSEEEKVMSDSGGEGTSSKTNLGRGTRRTRAKARRQAGEDSDPEEVIAEWKSKTRNVKEENDDVAMQEPDRSVTKEWWAQYVKEDDQYKVELSNKLFLLFEILKMCEEIGDKVLIFSQSILSLNIIESFLEVVDSKLQQECKDLEEEEKEHSEEDQFGRSWTKNLDYYRMDGSTSAQNRQAWASSFNDLDNYRARLFLISTRAGGLGINLVAANRVIIFDASWNPSHDVQSIFRVYRFGQTKPCYIYRFLAQGTMEEKIYERQVTKLSLSQRVVDEHQIERHFSANDLKELYNFRADKWDDGTEKPTLALPKDPLLAEILTSNKHCVVSFHEHDSLLENQVEQTLTEEEKKAAWEEYENEKKGIIVRGPGMERTASWPMMAAAQVLSREQITATVQALRQQLPDISEDLFHLHVQQALRRQVQLKQEEMRRLELLRLQEMNYLNMIKQQAEQSGLSHAQSMQAMQNMAPWMQIQRLRAMQEQLMRESGYGGLHPSASMSTLGQGMGQHSSANPISNKPEEAIDLDDN